VTKFGLRRTRLVQVALVAAGMLASGSAVAEASQCRSSSVAVSGGYAYFRFAAASQARAAWSRKVGRDAILGRAYAHWRAARDGRVTCRLIAQRYRCVAVAQPCASRPSTDVSKGRAS